LNFRGGKYNETIVLEDEIAALRKNCKDFSVLPPIMANWLEWGSSTRFFSATFKNYHLGISGVKFELKTNE